MGWASLIAALIQLLGPVLQEWLKDCTEEKLKEAAAQLPKASTFGSEGAAAAALFDKAIANQKPWALLRRRALKKAKAAAVEGDKVRRTPLSESEAKAAKKLVGGIRP
ncbi:MAG TPA: hypothetical protein VM529_24325 [Gemmata sp.]|nr:hypothetical protein [Gemmata sp.]